MEKITKKTTDVPAYRRERWCGPLVIEFFLGKQTAGAQDIADRFALAL